MHWVSIFLQTWSRPITRIPSPHSLSVLSFSLTFFPLAFSALTRLVGDRKGIRPVKTDWWGAGVVICLERGADLHMAQLMPLPLTISCSSKIHTSFNFVVPAHVRSRGQRAIKYVCVCVFLFFNFPKNPAREFGGALLAV